jgi:hypothetical protein
MAGWWWQGPDSESDCCCSMDAFELEVSGAVTGREAIDVACSSPASRRSAHRPSFWWVPPT